MNSPTYFKLMNPDQYYMMQVGRCIFILFLNSYHLTHNVINPIMFYGKKAKKNCNTENTKKKIQKLKY